MRYIDDQSVTSAVDAVGKVADVGAKYHEALTAAKYARDATRYGLSAIEVGLRNEAVRHANTVLELRRDELLDALDAVRNLIDDRPRAVEAVPS